MWLTNSETLLKFLEKEIAEGRNPKTPEQWQAFAERMRDAGLCLNLKNAEAVDMAIKTVKDN